MQGSWLGPLLFVIIISDLQARGLLQKDMDDSTITEEVSDPADSHLQEGTDNIVQWSDDNHMKINRQKTKRITFIPSLKINGLDIDRVTISNRLGIYVSSDLKWGRHVDKMHAKAFKMLYFLTCLKRADVEENELLDYYRTVIRSVVEYACPAWSTGITRFICRRCNFKGFRSRSVTARANK